MKSSGKAVSPSGFEHGTSEPVGRPFHLGPSLSAIRHALYRLLCFCWTELSSFPHFDNALDNCLEMSVPATATPAPAKSASGFKEVSGA